VSGEGDLYTKPIGSEQYILDCNIMAPELYRGFARNKVDFKDDFSKWTQSKMIDKLCTVMGIVGQPQHGDSSILAPQDPDEYYVLTADNVTKILAIQMRFRY
jgi:hypothetical protein